MSSKILVIDDEPRYARLMEATLVSEGYEVVKCYEGSRAILLASEQSPDLVLLDVMMPVMDGFETCARIREFSTVPIIMVTAKGEERDRVRGLDLGADDYIVKPFSAPELLARVRAVLRRAQRLETPHNLPPIFTHGELTINLARAEVYLRNKIVYLSATEYRILLYLANHAGQVITSESLLRDIWGDEYIDDKEILWVSISRLRQKLEQDPRNPEHILTRSGLGYTMPALNE
ncbi:MAG: response regulator transcription factor [Anaerolineales bacterium]|jgi:DNA-binding response OmpR family regulator|nr:response regulator transcription factor [Anaerolineales bacterium]